MEFLPALLLASVATVTVTGALKPAKIVQAADAIAYLPLYVAENYRAQCKLPDGVTLRWNDLFGKTERTPEAFLDGNERLTGDHGCLRAIVKAWEGERLPLIGICDPCEIVEMGLGGKLVMVGSLINKACFWALVDRSAGAVHVPRELGGGFLCIHDKSFATGHAIGRHVIHQITEANGTLKGTLTGDFALLVDGAVQLRKRRPETPVAAISASLLSCVLAARYDFEIAFPLHRFSPFETFLSTGIVVHREALKDKQVENAVRLLLICLMRAMNILRDCQAYAVDLICKLCHGAQRFEHERRLDRARIVRDSILPKQGRPNKPPLQVDRAHALDIYRALMEPGIYAQDCAVTSVQWANARSLRPDAATANLDDFYRCDLLHDLLNKKTDWAW